MMNNHFIEIIDSFVKECGKDQSISASIDKLIQFAKDNFSDLLQKVHCTSTQDLEDELKIAWNYEEENTYQYTLAKAITWFKDNFDQQKYSGGCLVKTDEGNKKTLYLCFLDKNMQPLLDSDSKYKVVNCKILDDNLTKQFGDKNMVVFR